MTTVTYLDEVAASVPGRAYKSRLLDLMDLRPGQTVLDIGCGPGTDLGDLADAVTRSGRVIGLDRDPLMADHARVRHGGRPNVEIRVGDAAGMPFDDAGIDRARTDRMLQHVADPARVLAEFRRVARPGATIAMAEPDWYGLLIDSPSGPGLTRFITTEVIKNPDIGRTLPRLCTEAGLTVRSVTALTPVITDFDTAEQILGLHRTSARAAEAGYLDGPADDLATGPFLAALTVFLVLAEAP